MPFLVKNFMLSGVDTLGLLYATFPLGYIIGGLTALLSLGLLIFNPTIRGLD